MFSMPTTLSVARPSAPYKRPRGGWRTPTSRRPRERWRGTRQRMAYRADRTLEPRLGGAGRPVGDMRRKDKRTDETASADPSATTTASHALRSRRHRCTVARSSRASPAGRRQTRRERIRESSPTSTSDAQRPVCGGHEHSGGCNRKGNAPFAPERIGSRSRRVRRSAG